MVPWAVHLPAVVPGEVASVHLRDVHAPEALLHVREHERLALEGGAAVVAALVAVAAGVGEAVFAQRVGA